MWCSGFFCFCWLKFPFYVINYDFFTFILLSNFVYRQSSYADDESKNVTIDMKEPVELNFAIQYLISFTKATSLSRTVTISLSPDMPIAVGKNMCELWCVLKWCFRVSNWGGWSYSILSRSKNWWWRRGNFNHHHCLNDKMVDCETDNISFEYERDGVIITPFDMVIWRK